MCVAGGVAPGLWVSHASGGSEIEIILQNRQSTVLHFVMPGPNSVPESRRGAMPTYEIELPIYIYLSPHSAVNRNLSLPFPSTPRSY